MYSRYMQFEESLGFVREESRHLPKIGSCIVNSTYLVLDGLHVLCHLGGRHDVFRIRGKDYYYLLGDTGDTTCSSDSLGPSIGA